MSVEMKLELGHRASMRDEPTAEGFTHDWLVFVKGAEGSNIFTFVDKVVFHLHESFPRPRRVVKEPPYQVAESGYAGFTMPIDVYFRSKEEPKKVRFEYDLFLRLEGSPVYNIRREKLTFQNPSEDFRRKLLKAREVSSGSTVGSGTPSLQTSASIQHVDESPRLASVHTKLTPVAEKKIKSHSTGKEASHSSHSKPNKILPPPSGALGNVSSKEPKPISKASHSPEGKEPRSKPAKPDKEPKSASKRPPPDGQNHHGSTEKKRRHHSSSDGNEKHAESNKAKETKEKKEKHKNQLSGHGSKREKHKSSSQSHVTKKDHHIIKSPSKSNSLKSVSPNRLSNEDSNDAKSSLVHGESNASSSASDLMDPTETWCEISPEKMDISSGKGSISPMSPEIEHSPPPVMEKLRRNSNHDTEESVEDKPPKPTPKAEKSPKPKNSSKSKKSAPQVNNHNNNNSTNHRSAKQNGSLKEVSHASPTAPKTKTGREALDPAYLRELVDLQKKIMSLEDRNLLQRVVDLIEETGRYQVTSKSFDFDLCSLDQSTVRKLKQCLLL